MKQFTVLLAFLLLACSVGTVAAANANYTSTISDSEIVRVNQSIIHDPVGNKAVPIDLWVYSGFIGLILIVLSLIKPRVYKMDYEVSIILSVLAWPFIMYWTWGGINSIDRITGVSMAAGNGTFVMITQHILYEFPALGYVGVAGIGFAIFVTILLISQFDLFKENEKKQNQNS